MLHIAQKSSSVTILFFVVLALGTFEPAEAQTAAGDFAELGQRVKPGDTIFVTSRESQQTRGRVVRLSPTSIQIAVDGQEVEMLAADIGWIERRGDRLWDGALAGAGTLGGAFMLGGAASCSPDCAKVVTGAALGGAAIGAGFGALFDALRRGRTLVHGTRPGRARGQLRDRPPTASLGDLWSRVRRGDTIYVRDTSGEEKEGTFLNASVSSLTMVVDGQAQGIPSHEVEHVRRRTSQLRRGLILGPPVGAVAGALFPGRLRSRTEGAVTGAVQGLALGAVVGLLLPRRTVVYRPGTQAAVSVTPVLAPGSSGVAFSVQF